MHSAQTATAVIVVSGVAGNVTAAAALAVAAGTGSHHVYRCRGDRSVLKTREGAIK